MAQNWFIWILNLYQFNFQRVGQEKISRGGESKYSKGGTKENWATPPPCIGGWKNGSHFWE